MQYIKVIFSLALSLTILTFPTNSQANLIINGSFEANQFKSSAWRLFNDKNVKGWNSSNKIELWHTPFNQVKAAEGSYLLELNSTKNTILSQSFETLAGQLYQLTFNYKARKSNKEKFKVSVLNNENNQVIFDQIYDQHTKKSWSLATVQFVAESNNTKLQFAAIRGTSRSVGNLLDDVNVDTFNNSLNRLTNNINVPEPSSLILLALGLLALIRFKK